VALLGEAALEKTVPQTLADAEREHILGRSRGRGRIKGRRRAAARDELRTLYGRMKKPEFGDRSSRTVQLWDKYLPEYTCSHLRLGVTWHTLQPALHFYESVT